MQRNLEVQTAHEKLKSIITTSEFNLLINTVVLSKREKEVVTKFFIDKMNLEQICISFESWGKKSIISYRQLCRIKTAAMKKIGVYLTQ
jgi:DNA-directed RNA polymerase specialized sigma subunit